MKSLLELEEQITKCHNSSASLSPTKDQRKDWAKKVDRFCESFLNELPDKEVFTSDQDKGSFSLNKIKDDSTPLSEILDTFNDELLNSNLNPSSPYFFGYIPGGGIYPSALGDYIAAVTNRFSGVFFANPAATRIENSLIEWMATMIGHDPKLAGGTLTSGGSTANLTAIITARGKLSYKERENAVVYLSSQTHHSIEKALAIAGMEHCLIRSINIDEQFKSNPIHLKQLITVDIQNGLIPWLIVSNAGTTNIGSIDPIEENDHIAKEFKLWHHINAAYGGFFALAKSTKESMSSLKYGDSVTLDPHKGLFVPYGLGAVIVKDHKLLKKSLMKSASYLQDFQTNDEDRSPDQYSIEMTRHFRGLRLWLPFQLLGLKPFKAALEEKHLLALWFYKKLSLNNNFLLGPVPELSVVSFRYIKSESITIEQQNIDNFKFTEEVIKSGKIFISSTKINGIVYLRLAVLCFRSKLEHVQIALEEIERLASSIQLSIKNSLKD